MTIDNNEIVRISVYLPIRVKTRIQELAKSEGRSMNDLISEWCRDRLSGEPIQATIQMILKRLDAVENKTDGKNFELF